MYSDFISIFYLYNNNEYEVVCINYLYKLYHVLFFVRINLEFVFKFVLGERRLSRCRLYERFQGGLISVKSL